MIGVIGHERAKAFAAFCESYRAWGRKKYLHQAFCRLIFSTQTIFFWVFISSGGWRSWEWMDGWKGEVKMQVEAIHRRITESPWGTQPRCLNTQIETVSGIERGRRTDRNKGLFTDYPVICKIMRPDNPTLINKQLEAERKGPDKFLNSRRAKYQLVL